MARSFDLGRIARALSDRAALFEGRVAKVGIPAGKTYPDGTSIGYIAAIQEYGAPEVGIPPRPFMRLTRARKQADWTRQLTEGAEAVVQRRLSLDGMLEAVGTVAAADMVETIARRVPPPLKPATIEARVRRARRANPRFGTKSVPATLSVPLNDTGTLVAHITHGVGPAGDDFRGGA